MAQIGVNAWVWTSPANTDEFGRLAPRISKMGFDLIEFGIEGTGDLDYSRAAEIARANGLGVSVCAAMGPDRDLIHPDEEHYLRDAYQGLAAGDQLRIRHSQRLMRGLSQSQRPLRMTSGIAIHRVNQAACGICATGPYR